MRLVQPFLPVSALCLICASAAFPQSKPFKSYKTNEEYCQDNPKATDDVRKWFD